MGKLQGFEVSLADNKATYGPGEAISGAVKISTAQPIQCKAIKVNCTGFCGVTSKVNDTAWTTKEQYCNSTVSVADKGTLRQGVHSFPFRFLLPASAPPSYVGPYGRIIYKIRAFIDTPRLSKDYAVEKMFEVVNPFNLNDVPELQGTNSASTTKNFSYMLMKSGTVTLNAACDLRGYTPGQVVQLETEVLNQSGKSTGMVVASLMQKVTYKAKKPFHDIRTVAEVEGPTIKGGKQCQWKEQIIVPELPQSSLAGCNIIDIEYFIQVSLKNPEVSVKLPIAIGRIPVDPTCKTPSRPVLPTPAPRVTPQQPSKPVPRPRSCCISPSAPPIDPDQMIGAGPADMPNRRYSQLPSSGQPPAVTPNAFSYTAGLAFQQNVLSPDLRSPYPHGECTNLK
uniref:Arrestin C-terminal-like domain-containing protein n=1 Tax=Denticeps clupeoides TaxID=299321 RepID=A0AAY4EKF8_9TELE